MKKSTGIVFLVVVALAAVAYFYDWKRHPAPAGPDNPNDVKMAFTIKPEDRVTAFTLTRNGTTMDFELKADGWYLTKPIRMRANQSAMADVTHDLGTVVEDRTLQPTPDQMKTYGLNPPMADLKFTLENGQSHTLRIGAMDFSGLEVYSQVDGDTKNVVLIAKNINESTNKSLEGFRDRSVLNMSYFEVTGFDLHNSSGEISATKQGDNWRIEKPLTVSGASNAIASMLQTVGAAQVSHFVNDDAKAASPATLAKYGLSNPAIRLKLTLMGGKSTELLIGKKDGAAYDAMDTSRAMIFSVPSNLVTALDKKVTDLQAKVLFSGSEVDVSRLELRGPGGATNCVKDGTGNLVLAQAPAQNGQAPDCPDFLTPIETAKAQKIDNQPPDSLRAKFTKPAVVVTLAVRPGGRFNPAVPATTDQGSSTSAAQSKEKELKIEISAPSGNTVYAKTSDSPTIYEFAKGTFDSLSAKPEAATPAAADGGQPAKK